MNLQFFRGLFKNLPIENILSGSIYLVTDKQHLYIASDNEMQRLIDKDSPTYEVESSITLIGGETL